MTTGERRRHVEVRRPLHMRRPTAVRARRRRLLKRRDGSLADILGAFAPDDLPSLLLWLVLLLAITALYLLGPWILALVAVLVESAIWVASIVVGIAAVRLLRRPYSVAVVDSDTGEVLARTLVTGRAAAELHADVVASRLREGLTPTEATSLDTAPA